MTIDNVRPVNGIMLRADNFTPGDRESLLLINRKDGPFGVLPVQDAALKSQFIAFVIDGGETIQKIK